ncbi:MAG: hypothetical protein ACU0DD_07380 [Paracoccus sp. (in: a-proteobacteria)]|uniref:Uncharacterized protein n=1 Tax=Paracoccus spongiarum TaxID=3064387 RepID=A0ABT9JFS5_9RHOB|nr:hypothetical protein [Paracoccus sp. 2205BS29-5]MDP5308658.1 hypothetical protein [Paracoccus sp. 2205BS29-5]
MNFESCGPFHFPRERTGRWRAAFWDDVEEYWDGLSRSVGCYAFCTDNGKKVRPWYVGKTLAQGGFRDEVFTPHKLQHYSEILAPQDVDKSYRRGKPCILLFPLVTESWRLSSNRSSSEPYIDWLETTLIGMALSQNPEIANTSKTRFHREVYVNGLIGGQLQGRPSNDANFAKRAFLSK